MNHIFGPVPSRRLGRSLGIDLVPFKTCSYDCIYCQLGRTTCKTVERKEYVPLDDVLEELQSKLVSRPDYITLSGSGEPTLYSRMDELIDRIKKMTETPIAVLTNGSLLWQAEVRRQLMNADLVVPSLDGGDEAMFEAVNRAHKDISFEKMLEGLITFRREFRGQYWLEVFLLAGQSATLEEVKKLAACVKQIKPDHVQLNTVARPPAETYARGVSFDDMVKWAKMFDPPVEVVADFSNTFEQAEFSSGREDILEMLRRRPCSIADIADGLGMHRNEVIKFVDHLSIDGLLEQYELGGKTYYKTSKEA
ncbi:MAG: radical SAM protein [Planctomycetes bacterium]|nr:radical SAM protein [Planctomycetota bacterium]